MRTIIPPGASLIPSHAKRVFHGIIFDIYQWPMKLFDGTEAIWEKAKRADSALIIAIKDDKLVIIKEQQPGKPLQYNIPGGRHDVESETELQAAQREMREETGLTFRHWKLLDVSQIQPKVDYLIYVFLAWDLESEGVQHLDAGERIQVELVALDQLEALSFDPWTASFLHRMLSNVHTIQDLINLSAYNPTEDPS